MKTIAKTIIFFLVLIGGTSAQAAGILQCVGMDGEGTTIRVMLDPDSDTLNVNGDIHKVISKTKGDNGVATENFKTKKGRTAYYSLTNSNEKDFKLYEFNVATNKPIAIVPLSCHKE